MTSKYLSGTQCDTAYGCRGRAFDEGKVSLRKFPYPYRAAMAICSDIDETKTTAEFLEIQRFLNTKNTTCMGEGVGLEIGNSLFFYDEGGAFSYFSHDEHAKRVILNMIRAGYIDCLHSYGDGATSRDQILRALDVLHQEDCRLDVWINHFGAPNCLSRKFEYMFGECRGDDPSSNVYHADVTLDYGIRFVWVGAHTRVIGQSPTNSSSPLSTVFDPRYPLRSTVNVLKEIRKNALGQWGDERYIMHRQNRVMRMMRLEDGRQVCEFMRYGNHPVSVGQGATSRGLSYMISRRTLEHLKARQGFMIVYTHLGKNSDCQQVIAQETQAALRNLEHEYRDGQIFVTTTSKLLNYYLNHRHLQWSHEVDAEDWIRITIHSVTDPLFGPRLPTVEELQGVTFYVPDRNKAQVYLGDSQLMPIEHNPVDHTGQESVMIPRTFLTYPLAQGMRCLWSVNVSGRALK
jgi:hypothetical protein